MRYLVKYTHEDEKHSRRHECNDYSNAEYMFKAMVKLGVDDNIIGNVSITLTDTETNIVMWEFQKSL
jgi:hypothetical protein